MRPKRSPPGDPDRSGDSGGLYSITHAVRAPRGGGRGRGGGDPGAGGGGDGSGDSGGGGGGATAPPTPLAVPATARQPVPAGAMASASTASVALAVPRPLLVPALTDDAAAKHAWLAKLKTPAWGPAKAASAVKQPGALVVANRPNGPVTMDEDAAKAAWQPMMQSHDWGVATASGASGGGAPSDESAPAPPPPAIGRVAVDDVATKLMGWLGTRRAWVPSLDAEVLARAEVALSEAAVDAATMADVSAQCESGDAGACKIVNFAEDAKRTWLSSLDASSWEAAARAVAELAAAARSVAPRTDGDATRDVESAAWTSKLDAPGWSDAALVMSKVAAEAAQMQLLVEQCKSGDTEVCEGLFMEMAKREWLAQLDVPGWARVATATSEVSIETPAEGASADGAAAALPSLPASAARPEAPPASADGSAKERAARAAWLVKQDAQREATDSAESSSALGVSATAAPDSAPPVDEAAAKAAWLARQQAPTSDKTVADAPTPPPTTASPMATAPSPVVSPTPSPDPPAASVVAPDEHSALLAGAARAKWLRSYMAPPEGGVDGEDGVASQAVEPAEHDAPTERSIADAPSSPAPPVASLETDASVDSPPRSATAPPGEQALSVGAGGGDAEVGDAAGGEAEAGWLGEATAAVAKMAELAERCESGEEPACDELTSEEETKREWLARLDPPAWDDTAVAALGAKYEADVDAADEAVRTSRLAFAALQHAEADDSASPSTILELARAAEESLAKAKAALAIAASSHQAKAAAEKAEEAQAETAEEAQAETAPSKASARTSRPSKRQPARGVTSTHPAPHARTPIMSAPASPLAPEVEAEPAIVDTRIAGCKVAWPSTANAADPPQTPVPNATNASDASFSADAAPEIAPAAVMQLPLVAVAACDTAPGTANEAVVEAARRLTVSASASAPASPYAMTDVLKRPSPMAAPAIGAVSPPKAALSSASAPAAATAAADTTSRRDAKAAARAAFMREAKDAFLRSKASSKPGGVSQSSVLAATDRAAGLFTGSMVAGAALDDDQGLPLHALSVGALPNGYDASLSVGGALRIAQQRRRRAHDASKARGVVRLVFTHLRSVVPASTEGVLVVPPGLLQSHGETAQP